jgi:hypothetical protein
VYSPTETTEVDLPSLPDDGSTIHGLGQLRASTVIDVVSDAETTEESPVFDTDLWLLDLGDRTSGEVVNVVIWLDRQFSDDEGASAPSEPWIAVAPAAWVPQPNSTDTVRDTSCTDSLTFAYPGSVIPYLYAQDVLSSSMYTTLDSAFSQCGVGDEPGSLTCDQDFDADGVTDGSEPLPTTFFTQVRTRQCDLAGNEMPEETYASSWLDAEELDDDDDATLGYTDATGGQAGATGEEGYIRVTLTGGEQYFVVVGDSTGGEGTYELSIRQVD